MNHDIEVTLGMQNVAMNVMRNTKANIILYYIFYKT